MNKYFNNVIITVQNRTCFCTILLSLIMPMAYGSSVYIREVFVNKMAAPLVRCALFLFVGSGVRSWSLNSAIG